MGGGEESLGPGLSPSVWPVWIQQTLAENDVCDARTWRVSESLRWGSDVGVDCYLHLR